SAQIREILISESAWEEMTCLFAPSLGCYIGQRSRLGVQVIILPGRIISPNTQLGPRVIVERNLPAGTYSLRQELIRTGD
ncbi:hypothetical protein P2N20_18120, partial [Escherichia coli]